MAITKSGKLDKATVRQRALPEAGRLEGVPGTQARFIGTQVPFKNLPDSINGGAQLDIPVRILMVSDRRTGQAVNDVHDLPPLEIVVDSGEYGQLVVYGDEGYFIDVVGVLPPGVPTSEHKPGADPADQLAEDPQSHLADIPMAPAGSGSITSTPTSTPTPPGNAPPAEVAEPVVKEEPVRADVAAETLTVHGADGSVTQVPVEGEGQEPVQPEQEQEPENPEE